MKKDVCPICGGLKTESETSFTANYNQGVIIVKEVPATVCQQCGEEWISDVVAAKLEEIVITVKKQRQDFFVAKFNNYSLAS